MSEAQTIAADPIEPATPVAAQPNAATTETATGAVDGGEESQAAEKTLTQSEVNEIVRKRVAAAEAKAERRVLRTLERIQGGQAQAQPGQTQAQAEDGKPTPRQGESVAEFADRLTDWKLEQREQTGKVESYRGKVQAAFAQAEKLAGFDPEDFAALPVTQTMTDAIVDADNPGAVMLLLQQNPEDAARIAKLPAARQAAEIGKLEVRAAQQKPVTRSNAPTALAAAKGATTSGSPDPSNTKAWIRWANEQERAAR